MIIAKYVKFRNPIGHWGVFFTLGDKKPARVSWRYLGIFGTGKYTRRQAQKPPSGGKPVACLLCIPGKEMTLRRVGAHCKPVQSKFREGRGRRPLGAGRTLAFAALCCSFPIRTLESQGRGGMIHSRGAIRNISTTLSLC